MKKSSTSKRQSKTEIALNEFELRYRTIMMSVGDGVIATDTEGRVEMMNPAAEELTGWKQEEARSKSLEKIFHIINEETRQIVENPVRRVMREGIVVGLANHSVLIAKNGTEHPVADSGSPIRNEKGDITGVVLVFRDQTQERMAQKLYRDLFENVNVGILRTTPGPEGAFIDMNPAIVKLFEADSREQLMTLHPSDIYWDASQRKIINNAIVANGLAKVEIKFKTLKGNPLWCHINSVKKTDVNGSIYFDSTIEDFTERKMAENQIRKLNRMYMVLSEVNQAIIRIHEPKELFEKVCRISVEQGGFRMAWIGLIDESSKKLQIIAQAGKTDGYLERIDISYNSPPMSYCSIDTALRQGKNTVGNIKESEEMTPCQKNAFDLGFRSSASLPLKVSGTMRGVLTFYSVEPEFFDEDELKLLDEMASDISFAMEFTEKETIRNQAGKALRESEHKFRETVKYLDEGYYSVTLDGLLLEHNMAFNRILGFDITNDMKGARLPDFWQNPDERKVYLQELMTRGYILNYLINAKKADGEKIIVMANSHLVKDENDKLVRIEGTFTDFTDLKLAEDEISKLNTELEDRVVRRTAQLETTNKELEAFSYSVSHDLRAPLRHISGYVELLNKHFLSDLPEKGQHYLNSIADSVRIMGMLIDDLLQFSRTGRLEMHQSNCDMNEIVKKVIESLNKDNPDRKIEWVMGELAFVYGDEAMLRLVWMNLLSNAVKFTRTRKKARIEIGVRKESKDMVFFVRDNGVGFDMQYAQKLFGVFQRLHPTEEFEGTGIGLANVHRIVLRHGGRTWAEAESDKGAEFNFSIPNNKEEM